MPVILLREHLQLYGEEGIERLQHLQNFSQERVVNASFVRMKNISLGYTFPHEMLEKVGLSSHTV